MSLSGARLDPVKDAALTRVEVDLDVDLFAQCVLVFNDPKFELMGGTDFAAGTAVKVELGYGAKVETLFEGEVVALEPQFRRDLPVSLQVVCQEALHRLALSAMTRAYYNADDAEVLKAVAQANGLSSEAASGTKEHLLQQNTSDAVFLRRLAQKQGHHLRLEGKKLILAPPPEGAELTIGPTDGARKIALKIKAGAQVSEVAVHGYDPVRKQEFVGKGQGQGTSGEGAKKYGGGAQLAVAGQEHQPADLATAEKMAIGRMRKLAEGHITLQLEMAGNAAMVPGAQLKLDKFGGQLDRSYRVEQAHHVFSKHGYFTQLRAVATKAKAPPRPVKPPPKPAPVTVQPQREPPAPAPPQPAPGQHIEVTVLDPLGNPKPNFFFKLTKPGSPEQAGMTDGAGKITLDLPVAGDWKLQFPDVDGAQPAQSATAQAS